MQACARKYSNSISIALSAENVTRYHAHMSSKKRMMLSIIAGLAAIAIAWMWATGTLSYPWIMLDRQVQLVSRCMYADPSFSADAFGFSIAAPNDYCVLPHRQFPTDASIQIVPKGYYFVFNEYALGTVVNATRASILFDHTTTERNAGSLLGALHAGGFLEGATIDRRTNKNGIQFVIVSGAKGIADDGHRFLWAFADHPVRPFTITILSAHPENPMVFNAVIDELGTI